MCRLVGFVIDASEVVKKFGRNTALSGVDLRVDQGSVVGLIGPNGAGKTTLMRMLVDIIRPTSGRVTVFGVEPKRAPARLRERIGYLPGEFRLISRHTGHAVLSSFADISGPVPPGSIERWAERVNLDLSKPVASLSKGNKQKIGLIQALMHEPDLIILDEPTSGLDPLIQREFVAIVNEAKGRGATVLLSSHVLGEIQQAAERVAVLSKGRLVAEGPLSSLALARYKRVRVVVSTHAQPGVMTRLEQLGVSRGVTTLETGDGQVVTEFRFTRSVHDLVQALATVELADLTIHEPDLEEAVLGLYDKDGDADD